MGRAEAQVEPSRFFGSPTLPPTIQNDFMQLKQNHKISILLIWTNLSLISSTQKGDIACAGQEKFGSTHLYILVPK